MNPKFNLIWIIYEHSIYYYFGPKKDLYLIENTYKIKKLVEKLNEVIIYFD
jgi:hypothetical protein